MIRASRAVTDKIGDAVGGAVTQTDMAEVLSAICKIDANFTKEEFVKQCQFEIIPTVLEAYLSGNEHVLEDWCHEAVSVCMRRGEKRGEGGREGRVDGEMGRGGERVTKQLCLDKTNEV